MNSTVKKLICEDSYFEEPQTLQDFGPIISNAENLAAYLIELGFIPSIPYNRFEISLTYYNKFKIGSKHTKYPNLKDCKIGVYTGNLDVCLIRYTNNSNKTGIRVYLSIPSIYKSRYDPEVYCCLYVQIHNAHLQNIAYMIEKALTHFEDAQKYIDSGKGIFTMIDDIRGIFRPLMDAEN